MLHNNEGLPVKTTQNDRIKQRIAEAIKLNRSNIATLKEAKELTLALDPDSDQVAELGEMIQREEFRLLCLLRISLGLQPHTKDEPVVEAPADEPTQETK